MIIADVIALIAVIVSVISCGISVHFAWKANDYSEISAKEAEKSTEAANRANDIANEANAIAEKANALTTSANETANKSFLHQTTEPNFTQIDACTRLLSSLKTSASPLYLDDAEREHNLKTLAELQAELKVFQGITHQQTNPSISVDLLYALSGQLVIYNSIPIPPYDRRDPDLDGVLYEANEHHTSVINAMAHHLPLLRTAIQNPQDADAWKEVREDRETLMHALTDFIRQVNPLKLSSLKTYWGEI